MFRNVMKKYAIKKKPAWTSTVSVPKIYFSFLSPFFYELLEVFSYMCTLLLEELYFELDYWEKNVKD